MPAVGNSEAEIFYFNVCIFINSKSLRMYGKGQNNSSAAHFLVHLFHASLCARDFLSIVYETTDKFRNTTALHAGRYIPKPVISDLLDIVLSNSLVFTTLV